MKIYIRKNIVFLCLTFIAILFLLVVLRWPRRSNSYEQYTKKLYTSPQELKQILIRAEELNRRRIAHIENVCRKYNLGIFKSSIASPGFKYPPTPQYSVFYFDTKNKIAYCPNYKAGSTTWIYNLLTLNGVDEESIQKKQISEIARIHFPELDAVDAESRFTQYKRLLCVRHPFDRILSAYRDKLEDKDKGPEHGTYHYYKRWGSKIRNKYRSSGQLEPTFEEFVRYLIETNLLLYADDHWIPYNAYCTPCLLRYDFVATVETLNEDQLFFIHSLGLESWLSPAKRHSSPKHSSQVSREYISQLTKIQVKELYNKFRLDFEMFNYSIEPYLNYAQD